MLTSLQSQLQNSNSSLTFRPGLTRLQHRGRRAPVQLTLNHAGNFQKSSAGDSRSPRACDVPPGISHRPSPPLATAVRRQEEAVHRSAVPHERRLAGRTGVYALRSDGPGPGEQQERHPAGLRAGAHPLRQHGECMWRRGRGGAHLM